MLRRWRNRRNERVRAAALVEAADDFAWIWADTVNNDSYAYGAMLTCAEAATLARLLHVTGFANHATDLAQEHSNVCNEQACKRHPAQRSERRAWEVEAEVEVSA